MWNPYEHMNAKWKKDFNDTFHFYNLMLSLVSMFTWEGFPDTINPVIVEEQLIGEGHTGFGEINGKLYVDCGGYCGDVVNYFPEEYTGHIVNVGDFRGKIGEATEVCWNNSLRLPDFGLMQYSNILTEIDVSERCNVLFSRLIRVPKVKDAQEQKRVESVIGDILKGRFTTVVSDNTGERIIFGDDTHPENNFLDLTDVSEVDKLQYLNKYRDNVIKRWFQMYGQGMQNTAKLAQQTTDELHGNDGVSMILPLDRLTQRQLFCDRYNKLFGAKYGEISVRFSDSYQESYEEMQETYSTGTKEVSPEEGGADNAGDGE